MPMLKSITGLWTGWTWRCVVALACVAGRGADGADVDFAKDVRPIFERHCLKCHGAEKQEGGLRLDRRAAGLKGGDNYAPAIKPGSAKESPLFQFVARTDADLRMPPKGPGLTEAELATIARWIDSGAKWPEDAEPDTARARRHWSFQPIVRPPLPTPTAAKSPAAGPLDADSPIDRFIAARLEAAGLGFSPRAERRTLIRRLYLVMLGVPPQPDEVEAFVADDDPFAWERLVDRVLANPRYGERWGQHWLDLVRFGESNGFETNRERPTAWHYRDYVIESLNVDRPYDQFVVEQLAGDSLGRDVATGFLVAGPYDLVKSQDVTLTLMQRQDELTDMINTTGTAFLGLTLGCARCHNHKFDPVTQRDFYALQAIFAGVQHGERPLPASPERAAQLATVDSRIRELARQLEPFIPPVSSSLVLLDDATLGTPDQRGVDVLRTPKGEGVNPPGTAMGQAQDAGDASRSPNLSGGKYTWWANEPEVDVVAYRPRVKGRYRVWISWGAGHATHTSDARYVVDADGDPGTRADQREVGSVDQRQFASGATPPENQSLWSGFRSLGIVEWLPSMALLVRGGQNGTAITADAVVFEAAGAESSERAAPARPSFREPVNARHNVDRFEPVAAKFLRFTILATNSGEPCLDELEAYSGGENVALAARGVRARASSSLPGYPIHKLEHLNDGRHGNGRSWISNEAGRGWVELEFPAEVTLDRVEWGRDREGQFRDRVAVRYRIEVARAPGEWRVVASSDDRLPVSEGGMERGESAYRFDAAPPELAARGRQWLAELEAAKRERVRLAATPTAYAGTFANPPAIHRLYRGDPQAPREVVGPDTIAALGTLDLPAEAPERERRLTLARWIARRDNPLTARVWVNRLWQFQFGRGLVETPSDLGANGIPPSHPELLDWLASELIASGWSTKHVQRLILLSRVWQQDSRPTEAGLAADAGCRWWWRFPPRRLEAEAIRDSVLAASGVLDQRAGGPGFDGFEVQLENVRHYFPKQSFGPADWRRMVYMTKVRMEKEAVFGVFDCPDASQVMPRRSQSTTPLQALNLLNSAFILQQADLLAERLQREAGPDPLAQARCAVELCYGRPIERDEQEGAAAFIATQGLAQFCRAMLNSNELLFVP